MLTIQLEGRASTRAGKEAAHNRVGFPGSPFELDFDKALLASVLYERA